MKILSLFDGISCGYLALERAGIPIDKYYASEIDKFAIEIAKANHPDIEEIGDVCNIKGEDYKDIDLIMGGSPCQNLSGIGNGKGLEGEKSKLFFEFVRLVKEIRPKFFLLENVKMKKEWMERMSEELFGIPAVLINSSLLSAQNRPRLYWVGVRDGDTYKQVEFPMPEDKGITIKDILDKEVDDKYYLSQDQIDKILHWKSYQNPLDKVLTGGSKCPTLTARGAGEWHSGMILLTDEGKEIELPCATQLGNGYGYPNAFGNNKAYCLRAVQPNGVILGDKAIRKLTPTECERLQTVGPIEKKYEIIFDGGDIEWFIELVKNCVNVEEKNLKLQNAVESVEKGDGKETVQYAEKNLNINNQQIKKPVQENVHIKGDDSQQVKLYLNEQGLFVKIVDVYSKSIHLKKIGNFAHLNVIINSILERIVTLGNDESQQIDKNYIEVTNGKIVLKRYGKGIMQLAKDVEKNLTTLKEHLKSTTRSHLNIKDIEQNLVILFYCVIIAIAECIQDITLIKNGLKINIEYGYTDVNNMKDRQRYKVLGNGWTVDVIAHIFSHLPIDNA